MRPLSTAVALTALLGAANQAFGGVRVALLPSAAQVVQGGDFHVVLRVTEAGSLFNSYQAIVSFDPTDVTFVQEPAAVQEGAYMRDACGSTFNSFVAAPSQLSIQHSLLCPGISLGGPGDLYVLHFRANAAPGMATIAFAYVGFYNSGIDVPVSAQVDATIQIGSPVDAAGGVAESPLPGFLVAPNPFDVQTHVRILAPASSIRSVRIYDARGSLVRALDSARPSPSETVLAWDGRNSRGDRSPAGVYWITVRMDSRQVSRRVTLVR